MYKVEVKEYSGHGHGGPGLLSVEWEFPRKVLAEVKTHRLRSETVALPDSPFDFDDSTTTYDTSKNSASSRAIPLRRMVEKVMLDPYIPERFSLNGRGMQGHGWAEGKEHNDCVRKWLQARNDAVANALSLCTAPTINAVLEQMPGDPEDIRSIETGIVANSVDVHKQEVNRLLEPFAWVVQLITMDDQGWANFWTLRCHKDADPAFQKVARMSYLAARKVQPTPLQYGQWHLPYVSQEERRGFRWIPNLIDDISRNPIPDLIQASIARACWISYANQDKDATPEAIANTFKRLQGSEPVHASPLEHQATPLCKPDATFQTFPHLRSNFQGWLQCRKLIPRERATTYTPSQEELASWGLPLD